MAWWKQKTKPGASDVKRCELCGEELSSGSRAFRLAEWVNVADDEPKLVHHVCGACWQRHLAIEQEAEARFRRENLLEDLCAALRQSEAFARGQAAGKLQRLGDKRAVGALCEALAREPRTIRPPSASGAIITALAALGGPEAERALIAELSNEKAWDQTYDDIHDQPPDTPVELWINRALLKMGGPTLVVRALLDTMMSRDTTPSVRRHAADELCNIAYRSDPRAYSLGGITPYDAETLTDEDRALMIAPMRAALYDDDAGVRYAAERTLPHLKG